MTRTGAAARPPIEERTETFIEWIYSHVKEIGIATAALVVVLAAVWLYRSNQATKALGAERAFYQAQQAFYSGNLPLAQTDLQKVVTQFDGTTGAVQAAILLAQVHYDQGNHAQGIQVLENVADEGAAEPFRASIHALIASGYEGQQKFKEAAEAYQQAAQATQYDAQRDVYRSHAARSFQTAGDTATARRLWTELAEDPNAAVAGEARIRLGELTANPARS